ncbi:MAG: hypothetical protein ABSG04_04460 [Verrucomicrobiota bacterium]|jgi:hypothetical protein
MELPSESGAAACADARKHAANHTASNSENKSRIFMAWHPLFDLRPAQILPIPAKMAKNAGFVKCFFLQKRVTGAS